MRAKLGMDDKMERGSESKRWGKTKGLSNSKNEESGIAIRCGKEQTTF